MAQVQAEMKAYCCEELWFLCSTPQSASISFVYFDSDLWEKIWGLVKCLYKPEKPTVPTKLHPTVKDTGRERLIRSHSSARFSFELSGNSN